jgi:hypothetical protein
MPINTSGFLHLGGEKTATEGVAGTRATLSVQPGVAFEYEASPTALLTLRGDAYLQFDTANPTDSHLSEGVRLGPAVRVGKERRWSVFPFLEGRITENFGTAPVATYQGTHEQNLEMLRGIGLELAYRIGQVVSLRAGAHLLQGFTSAQVAGDGTGTEPSSDTRVIGAWGGISVNLNALLYPVPDPPTLSAMIEVSPGTVAPPAVSAPPTLSHHETKVRFRRGFGGTQDMINPGDVATALSTITDPVLMQGRTITVRGFAEASAWTQQDAATSHAWNLDLARTRAASTAAVARERLTAQDLSGITVNIAAYDTPAGGFTQDKQDFSYPFYSNEASAVLLWETIEPATAP